MGEFFEIGKQQPQATETEEIVLGSILIEDCIGQVADILTEDSFYDDKYKTIYKAILSLYKKQTPVDLATVANELKRTSDLDKIGGAYFLATLTNKVASSANIEHHARIVQEKFIQRELIRMGTEIIKTAYSNSGDIFDIVNYTESSISSIYRNINVGKVENIKSLWEKLIEHNEILINNNGVSGISTGYKSLDKITGGWQNTSLVVLAARPGMGKTSLIINFARHAAINEKIPVLIFSLEMSSLQIAQRAFSLESNTSNTAFIRKGLEKSQIKMIEKNCATLIDSPIFIDDTPSISLFELRSKARKLKKEYGIRFIIIDYLQLMSGDRSVKSNREQEISGISRGLKGLAKELDLPIIALSQLSRETEKRGDKRPQLSDLRESGAIEQDADMVMFIHRPEYYGITEDENGQSVKGLAEIIFAKHRIGGTGTAMLRWIDYLTKFEDLESEAVSEPLSPNTEFINEDEPF